MRLATQRSKSLVNLTPLIDVVFILLIFFMLASNFIQWQFMELGIEEIDEMVVDQEKISILTIKADNSLRLNSEEVILEDAVSKVTQQLSINSSHAVVIQPEAGVTLQQMINILEPMQEIAGENVSLATPEVAIGEAVEN